MTLVKSTYIITTTIRLNRHMHLSFRDVSESTRKAYHHYFQSGHSAATARHHHELNLLLSLPKDETEPALADRSINPQPNDVSRLFQKWRETQANGDKMFTRLEAEVKRYNNKTGGKAYVQRCVKAIPWGIVITSGESVPIIFEAFSKLKSILPEWE